jgi:hypothetical protein
MLHPGQATAIRHADLTKQKILQSRSSFEVHITQTYRLGGGGGWANILRFWEC